VGEEGRGELVVWLVCVDKGVKAGLPDHQDQQNASQERMIQLHVECTYDFRR